MALHLKIISPERIEFDGDVASVALPGTSGRFEILGKHAPLISSLETGAVEYVVSGGKKSKLIRAGFVSVKDDEVSVCVEI
ncbi:MAG: F0F1 ATP synthase subunit epsilon [Prevotella sp.]|nr:F0F1 ATP synthase subunit epsilon [Prevotella sp.]